MLQHTTTFLDNFRLPTLWEQYGDAPCTRKVHKNMSMSGVKELDHTESLTLN